MAYCKDLRNDPLYRQQGGYPVAEGCRQISPGDPLPPLSVREGHQVALRTKFVDFPGAACGIGGTIENHPVLFISGCHTTVGDRCKSPWGDAILAVPFGGLCEDAPMVGFTDNASPLNQDPDHPERYVAWYSPKFVPDAVANLPVNQCGN